MQWQLYPPNESFAWDRSVGSGNAELGCKLEAGIPGANELCSRQIFSSPTLHPPPSSVHNCRLCAGDDLPLDIGKVRLGLLLPAMR